MTHNEYLRQVTWPVTEFIDSGNMEVQMIPQNEIKVQRYRH